MKSYEYHRFLQYHRRNILRKNFSLLTNKFIIKNEVQDFSLSRRLYSIRKLTPQEVTSTLQSNEFSREIGEDENCAVKSYDCNQLPSNNPIEDTRAEARCLITGSLLFGIFDGHGGAACAQVVAKRLFKYICLGSLPTKMLENFDGIRLLESFNVKYELVAELKKLYGSSLSRYARDLLISRNDGNKNRNAELSMQEELKKAFLRLDDDISKEALSDQDDNNLTVSIAVSGCVACVAHINGAYLHVATTGDCQAVIGAFRNNSWVAERMSVEHNADNAAEVARIHSEHPTSEHNTIIRQDRLLGELAPLRAFGDVRYKWNVDLLNKRVVPYFGPNSVPSYYHTPPYLTAVPDVTHRRLRPPHKFLIIASDGLWDMMTPQQAVKLVGQHMQGKVTLSPFKLPTTGMKLGEVSRMLAKRREGLSMKPIDSNAATHLIRNALGGYDGLDHQKVSAMLSLPANAVRMFRDDISVTVAFFDSDYLSRMQASTP